MKKKDNNNKFICVEGEIILYVLKVGRMKIWFLPELQPWSESFTYNRSLESTNIKSFSISANSTISSFWESEK
jgi:hypothetical protein